MNRLRILITGSGAPGIKGTLYSLRNNFDNRCFFIIGTDMNEEVAGKYLCDKFYVIPKATDVHNYLNSLRSICSQERVDVIIPQNTNELLTLSSNAEIFSEIGTKIVISNKKSIKIANNKYKLLKQCSELDLNTAEHYLVDNQSDLLACSKRLGWPDKRIVLKPPSNNGSRGVRIIDENLDRREIFYKKKPSSLLANMKEIKNILGNNFPDLLLMEYLPGNEFTVDVLRHNGYFIAIPRIREEIKAGITFNGTVIKNKDIMNYSKKIADQLELKYFFGFQFKLDEDAKPKIIECNPRVQGTMVLSTFAGANIIYGGIKAILGENLPKFDINWGTSIIRYWGGLSTLDEKVEHKL